MGERLSHAAGDVTARGYLARPDAPNGAGVLVLPAFAGLRAFEMEQCDRMAALGYVALGVDYYGEGWVAETTEEAMSAMARLDADRAAFRARTEGALAELGRHCDGPRGAFGFCLGGKAVLDLARAGHLDAAVSLHGLYDPPPGPPGTTVAMPPVLLCHGWDDPLATPEDFAAMARELDAHCGDWHAVVSGGTGHAFTNPARTDDYVERAATRSFAAMDGFLARCLLGS